jgi:hypothetical protein
MNVIYVARWHDQLLNLWREQRARSLSVLHLDFHCDLRGLLIDRGNQRAFRIWDRFSAPDPGNFLTHAVLLGHVDSVRWVHDDPGGRRHDIGTVKYESDLTALPYRFTHLLGRNPGVPIGYQVIPYDSWDGLREGEFLDIDWDFFASTEYPISSIEGRIEAFLARDFPVIPEETFISYSPEYSHPTEARFRQFIEALASTYHAQVVQLSPEIALGEPFDSLGRDGRSPLFRLARRTYHATNRELRRRGIY